MFFVSRFILSWHLRSNIYGFELGNELDGGNYESTTCVEPATYAHDYKTLRNLIDQYWGDLDRQSRPKLVGPAQHPNVKFARTFLGTLNQIGDSTLDVFTFHDYVGIGLDPDLKSKLLSSAYLESEWDLAKDTVHVAMNLAPTAEIWMGEGSAAWHSGECGITDRITGSFWYVDRASKAVRTIRGGKRRVLC